MAASRPRAGRSSGKAGEPRAKKTTGSPTAPASADDGETRSRILPRHEILKVKSGLPGYRRGCKCEACRKANADRVREHRERKAAAAGPKQPKAPHVDLEVDVPTIIIDELEPGSVTRALEAELPKTDGANPFQSTVHAMMRKAALIVDNADRLNRMDLLNPMMLRLYGGMNVLNPAASRPRPSSSTLEDELAHLAEP